MKEEKEFKLNGHKIFLVYQNKTYEEELRGGFLWSPQYTVDGKRNPGYEAMKEVRKGDIIFHSVGGMVVAVSKAQKDCYPAPRPYGFEYWNVNGWRIDSTYRQLCRCFCTTKYGKEMFELQPPNGPFCSDGRGKQQYLCNVNQTLFSFIMNKILPLYSEQEQKAMLAFMDVEEKSNLGKDYHVEYLDKIENECKVDAIVMGACKETTLTINVGKYPVQRGWIGKEIGDLLETNSAELSYRVRRIYREK